MKTVLMLMMCLFGGIGPLWAAGERTAVKSDQASLLLEDGNEKMERGYFSQAIGKFKAAHDQFADQGDQLGQLKSMNGIGESLVLCGNFTGALDALEGIREQLSTTTDPDIRRELIRTHRVMGTANSALGRVPEVQAHFQRAFALLDELGDSGKVERAHTLTDFGTILVDMFQFQAAEDTLLRSLAIFESLPEDQRKEITGCYNNLAYLHISMGDVAGFMRYVAMAIKELKRSASTDHYVLPTLIYHLGLGYQWQGRVHDAQTCMEWAVRQWKLRGSQEKFAMGMAYCSLNHLYQAKGEADKQRDAMEQAHRLLKEAVGEDGPFMENIYNIMGNYYANIGDYNSAVRYHEKTRELLLRNEGRDSRNLGQCLENLGISYMHTNQLGKAEETLREGIAVRLRLLGPDAPEVGNAYGALGYALVNMERYSEAEEAFEKALKLVRRGDDPLSAYSEVLTLRGVAYSANGQYEKAVESFRQGLQAVDKVTSQNRSHFFGYCNLISQALMNLGKYEEAYLYTQKALDQYHAMAVPAESQSRGIPLYDESLNEALSAYHVRAELLPLLQERGLAAGTEDGAKPFADPLEDALLGIGVLEQLADRIASEEGRDQLYRDHRNLFEGGLHALSQSLAKGEEIDPEIAIRLSEKYKANQLLKALRSSGASELFGVDKRLLQLEHELKVDYAYYERMKMVQDAATGGQGPNPYGDKCLKISIRKDSLREVFRSRYPDYYRLTVDPSTVSLAGIRDTLLGSDPQRAYLEYFWGSRSAYLLAISANDFQLYEIPLEEGIREQIGALRRSLAGKENGLDEQEAARLQHHLFAKFVAPALRGDSALLDADAVRRLTIVRDGPLRTLPFEAFLSQEPTEAAALPYLIRDYSIGYALSGTVQLENVRRDAATKPLADRTLLAFSPDFSSGGFPDGLYSTEGLPDLKASKDLLESLCRRYSSRLYQGEEATEVAFKDISESSEVLFLNTHGFFHDSLPMHSGIVFSQGGDSTQDGILYTRELFNMALNTRLAVLNACNTGFGKQQPGENLMSLSRGFAYAGCPSMVSSLWDQVDATTADIYRLFFSLLEQGLPKDEALRQAKLQYLEQSDAFRSHPSYWAHLTLIGSVEPLSLPRPARPAHLLLVFAVALVVVGGTALVVRGNNHKNRG